MPAISATATAHSEGLRHTVFRAICHRPKPPSIRRTTEPHARPDSRFPVPTGANTSRHRRSNRHAARSTGSCATLRPRTGGIMPSSNAAIHYVPAGYDTSGPKLMGRMAAGEGFLDAYLRHAGVERFYCYAAERKEAAHFA